MKITRLIALFKQWAMEKLTGVVTIHFHEGGIRKVRLEHDVK